MQTCVDVMKYHILHQSKADFIAQALQESVCKWAATASSESGRHQEGSHLEKALDAAAAAKAISC